MTRSRPQRAPFIATLIAVAFIAGHLPWLGRTLEDIDSVNFALGVVDYDVGSHQPHPPGYPIYIALAKASTLVIGAMSGPATPDGTVAAQGLAVWSAVFGGLALVAFFVFFRGLDGHPWRALAATFIVAACPVYWVAGSRPMSDLPGLAMAAAAQALLATAFFRQRRVFAEADRSNARASAEGLVESGRLIVAGALVTGLALGMRSQTAWLTLPMLVAVIAHRAGRGAAGAVLGSTMTFGIGVAAWALPLMVASGGPAAYLAALSSQAGEDFAGVDMLATNPSLRRLAFGLLHTFVDPWVAPTLAASVLILGVVGALALAWKDRAALILLAAATVPYAVFHLGFQETFTTRYALPLVPAMAYLAVRGLAVVGTPVALAGAMAMASVGLWLAVPATALYAREGSPVFRGAAEIEAARRAEGVAPVVAMHDAIGRALRGEPVGRAALTTLPGREWFEVARTLEARDDTVWFLADPRRTDLALVDRTSQQLRGRYRLQPELDAFLGGLRPPSLDWVQVRQPGWFAAEGWALTPETAGISRVLGRGPADGGIVAHVRRRPEAATLLVGGRNLGAAGDPAARFTLTIDDAPVDSWEIDPAPGFFLRTSTLPEGALEGEGRYAHLVITATAADAAAGPVAAAIEQFDLQPLARVVYGFDEGWHELEYAPAAGRLWRWTSETAVVRVVAPGAVRVVISGESPVTYFDAPATITLDAAGTTLGRWRPEDDFVLSVEVPADVIAASNGRLTLRTDRTWVPDERTGNGDRRRLGLRIFDLTVSDLPVDSSDFR